MSNINSKQQKKTKTLWITVGIIYVMLIMCGTFVVFLWLYKTITHEAIANVDEAGNPTPTGNALVVIKTAIQAEQAAQAAEEAAQAGDVQTAKEEAAKAERNAYGTNMYKYALDLEKQKQPKLDRQEMAKAIKKAKEAVKRANEAVKRAETNSAA